MNSSAECPVCRGNDADMPCAYPGESLSGCLRDERLQAARCQRCHDPMPWLPVAIILAAWTAHVALCIGIGYWLATR